MRPTKDESAEIKRLIDMCVEVWAHGEKHDVFLPPHMVVERLFSLYKLGVSKVTVINHYTEKGIIYDNQTGMWLKTK